MSVVNKMLRDLEAREAQAANFSADYQAVKSRPYARWAVILLTVGGTVALAWMYFAAQKQTPNVPPIAQGLTIDQQPGVKQRNTPPQPMAKPVTLKSRIAASTRPEEVVPVDQLAANIAEVEVTVKSPEVVTTTTPGVATQTSVVPAQKPLAETQGPTPAAATFSMNNVSTVTSQAGLKQNINDALASGKTLLAIDGLQRLLSSEPTNLRARKKLASLLFAENSIAQAKLVLQQGMSLHPAQTDLRLMLAKLLVQQNNTEGAIQLLREYSPSAVAQPDYYAYRGALAQRLGIFPQAQQDYLLLSRSDSSQAKWWLGLAIAQDSLGYAQEARQAYARADDGGQLSPQVIQFVRKRMNDLMGVQ